MTYNNGAFKSHSVKSTSILLTLVLGLGIQTTRSQDVDSAPINKSPLELTLKSSHEKPTVREINSERFKVKVMIKNVSDQEVTIWTFLDVSVKTERGENVKQSTRLGRWGLVRAPSLIEAIEFKTLKPGETHHAEFHLKRFAYDSEIITGWKIPSAGQYILSVSYDMDQKRLIKRFGKGCKKRVLQDPTRPWNKLIDAKVSKSLKLAIEK